MCICQAEQLYKRKGNTGIKLNTLIIGCIALLLGSGCSDVSQSNNGLVFISTPAISANPNPSVPLGAVLKFETNRPVHTNIRITDGKNGNRSQKFSRKNQNVKIGNLRFCA